MRRADVQLHIVLHRHTVECALMPSVRGMRSHTDSSSLVHVFHYVLIVCRSNMDASRDPHSAIQSTKAVQWRDVRGFLAARAHDDVVQGGMEGWVGWRHLAGVGLGSGG